MRLFQKRVKCWVRDCLGEESANNQETRNYRFLEEAIELVQALGANEQNCHALVSYIFARKKGKPAQEVGGVMTTLAALSNCAKLNIRSCYMTEIRRMELPEMMEKIKFRQAEKLKITSFTSEAK